MFSDCSVNIPWLVADHPRIFAEHFSRQKHCQWFAKNFNASIENFSHQEMLPHELPRVQIIRRRFDYTSRTSPDANLITHWSQTLIFSNLDHNFRHETFVEATGIIWLEDVYKFTSTNQKLGLHLGIPSKVRSLLTSISTTTHQILYIRNRVVSCYRYLPCCGSGAYTRSNIDLVN